MHKDFFFSIVIPAHNEEKYIGDTLRHLEALEYPNELYEVIVVENASTDTTYEIAKAFNASSITVIKIPETDVSGARQAGASAANKEGDWVLFLDADTFPEPGFLRSLSNFLNARANHGYLVGTFELRPQSSFPVRLLYSYINFSFRMNHVAYGGALLVKRPFLNLISFEGNLIMKKDAELVGKISALSSFFFFSTNLLQTSGRRCAHDTGKVIEAVAGLCLSARSIRRNNNLTACVIWE